MQQDLHLDLGSLIPLGTMLFLALNMRAFSDQPISLSDIYAVTLFLIPTVSLTETSQGHSAVELDVVLPRHVLCPVDLVTSFVLNSSGHGPNRDKLVGMWRHQWTITPVSKSLVLHLKPLRAI